RHALLDTLQVRPVPRLLIVCDAYQTPDRGTLAYIAELAACAGETRVSFMPPPAGARELESRLQTWRPQLEAAGLQANHIHSVLGPALAWLEQTHHDAAPER